MTAAVVALALALAASAGGAIYCATALVKLSQRLGIESKALYACAIDRDNHKLAMVEAIDEVNALHKTMSELEANLTHEIESLYAELSACGDPATAGSAAVRGLRRILTKGNADAQDTNPGRPSLMSK